MRNIHKCENSEAKYQISINYECLDLFFNNLLHDFSDGKYMLFFLLKKKNSCEKYGPTQPDLQPN